MNAYWKWALIGLLVAGLGMGTGCGDDDSESGTENNQAAPNNQEDPNGDEEIPNRCDDYDLDELPELEEGSTEVSLDASYDMRMNEFAFSGGSPGRPLNGVINSFLDQEEEFPIIVLLELREIDQEEGTLQVRGGAGLHAEEPGQEEYVWDAELEEPDFTEGEIDGAGNFQATLPLLNFVATVNAEGELLKTVIPIRDLALEATLELDGDDPVIDDASLTGIVREDEASDVRIALTPGQEGVALPSVLGVDDMNFDYECDGGADAWLMSAEFSAQRTVIVE